MTPMPAAHRLLLVTFNWSTLTEMPFLLKQAGCQVDVLCPRSNLAIQNGYYDRWIDAGDTQETLIAGLIALANQDTYRYILIGDDPILWKIYRERITALWPLLPIKNPSALPILNKVGFAAHCVRHGIRSPAFHVIGDRAEAATAMACLGLPLVLKANYSNGGHGVTIVTDAAAFQAAIAAHDFSEPLLAQQFIAGRQIGTEALFKNGQLLQYVCSEDIEPTRGPSTKRRYFPNDDRIGQLLRQLGQSARLHGFVNGGLLQDHRTQDYYLFEADPRPNKWVPYARWFGRDFAVSFRTFLDEAGATDALVCVPTSEPAPDGWEVEHFTSHFAKLLNAGRYLDAIQHLLDVNRNVRYTAYDPTLLKVKMDKLHQQIGAQREAAAPTCPNPRQAAPGTLNQPPERPMRTLTIDHRDYDLDRLSADAKAQLQNIQFVDQELARLRAQTAAMQTARNAYVKALKAALPAADATDTRTVA